MQNNKYREALIHTQKAIINAETNDNVTGQASQNYNIGKLYYDLKKYDDAIETLTKSTELYSKLEPSAKQVAA